MVFGPDRTAGEYQQPDREKKGSEFRVEEFGW
jgi:hypothetical protein